jgi:hypothetical protein
MSKAAIQRIGAALLALGLMGLTPPALTASSETRATDGRSLAGETAETQALFQLVWGDAGAERWAMEHSAELRGDDARKLASAPPTPTTPTPGPGSAAGAAISVPTGTAGGSTQATSEPAPLPASGVFAWGEGVLGTGYVTRSPKQVVGLPDLLSVAAGDQSSLGLAEDGAVSDLTGPIPRPVEGLPAATAIASDSLRDEFAVASGLSGKYRPVSRWPLS